MTIKTGISTGLKFGLLVCCLAVMLSFGVYAQGSESAGFPVKGFHLDLRIQVMTPEALKSFTDQLSEMGMNTLVMEWEGTYPFEKHATISNEYSYTREEILDFVAYCENLGIDVIPLQQSLGHVEYILRNPRYSHLKEDRKDISQICPMKSAESKALFTDLFSDLVSTHDSDFIHIGGDETKLLGHCPVCAARVEEVGKSKLFVDHMKMIAEIVIDLGKKPVMWADIILKYPEAAEELPAETIFIDWNYGWRINHFGNISDLQEKGFVFWGAPSIRCHPDNWFVTDWPTHFKNQKEFIPYAREAGYEGMIMTSWSTTGVYGFTWDVGYDVIDMVQIRNTYPMSGFRVLMASYDQTLDQSEVFDPETFVLKYAKERFGLKKQDAATLWQFLSVRPELIANGKPQWSESVSQMAEKYAAVRDPLVSVKPNKNEEEFDHFKLMADLRMHYLDFKQVEARYNSEIYTPDQAAGLLSELDRILAEAKALDARFTELNKGFLYDSELQEQNELRVQQIHVLYDRLAKLK
ncbi:family 20 glycosylhydrolase [Marinoscillum furvescens]|uniref:Glycosyl hydrolase family 20 n=1 Tax=Marinoscillum furvescens DSM 4134 TaxID=1122208 RepID=A0A3D9LHA4_MARFU|nr:family 20 glycosylhydrolase [Marinoscillum furvescens]REE05874.1 glycosyl hydrolase family 20 [Marinoscillum furvescens DSM 4134]